MVYGSVCSGIEAASVAWHPLGWRAAFLSEIEPFPRAVLSHRFPGTPLHGDFTTIKAGEYEPIDLLVGGTPCQSFSIAGLRGGLGDDRGNLALEYLRLADRLRPRWTLWENVPGVLSSNAGRDFGAILGGLVELGYGFAYRVLDAQFVRVDGLERAVPQRRQRVFVVGYLGDWRRAAAVLFERESLSWNPAPRRESGKGVAPTIAARTRGGGGLGTDFDCDGGLICADVASTLDAHFHDKQGLENQHVNAGMPLFVAHSTPIAFDTTQITSAGNYSRPMPGDPCHPLAAGAHAPAIAIQERAVSEDQGPGGLGINDSGAAYTLEARHHAQAVAFDLRGREGGAMPEGPHDTANIRAASGGSSRSYVAQARAVRRLTPRECERLQGFPENWTDVPYRGKPAADGPRYKALGNSMAVNCMRWIGQRIDMVEKLA